MRRTTVRRTAVAASAISMALLLSACGADKSADAAPDDKAPGKATKALSQAELDKLVLAEGDLKNHKVTEPSKAEVALAKTATSDKAECKPLVDAMMLKPVGSPAATTSRKISTLPEKPAKDATTEEKAEAGLAALGKTVLMSDGVGSYEGKGAQEALAALRTAGEACAGGFTMTAGSDKTKVTKLAPGTYAGGDEAVAFTVTTEQDGAVGTSQLVTVRKGNALVSFFAISLAGKTEQPKAAIDAQLAKLG
ncbi:hypothetical protein J7E96_22900 [Streptomyces sp. ISL-96]|uniref:hypothetical protein n=1 Tax=Streptomyces sp. ISL-96 TaxID=2819191 RepID=UPI001BEB37E7|nr:hypothetical protein [Streptomyces sp. ISL-96]MBT2491318.1 hypothetical protein [Streptomyces sp. ISL-96]